ncbi:MAG: ABC transporter substrate-binding protein [Alistipes sp.]|nr:ABC transporter substrate-binding protein [Alistipes sp.]
MIFGALVLADARSAAAQDLRVEIGEEQSAGEIRRQARLFDEHIVRMGETGFSIARGYAIAPKTLADDNPGVDLVNVKVGQVLLIRKRERGRTEPERVASQWDDMMTRRADDETARRAALAQSETSRVDTLWSVVIDGHNPGGLFPDSVGRRSEVPNFGDGGGVPRIALMLPLNQPGIQFTDFYRGALVAFEDMKKQGRSAQVTLYNSENSAEKVQRIVTSGEFAGTDLIIGPVYEDEMGPAVRFGEAMGVPVVSPLATLREMESDAVWQMAPDAESKYDKLRPTLHGDVNIVIVSSGAANDAEFEREISAELGRHTPKRFNVPAGGGVNFAALLDWNRPNVVIVLAGSELSVNLALATISSSYNLAVATRPGRPSITVVGTSRWANYSAGVSLDPSLLFKLNTSFVTNYHIDRANPETRFFEARYLELFGDTPSKSAFRGYDAVALFVSALFESGESFGERIERVGIPLGTGYRFVRDGGYVGRHVNDQWTFVTFSSDYNMTTE